LGGAEVDLVNNAVSKIGGLQYGIVPGAKVHNGWFDNVAVTGLGNDASTKGQEVSLHKTEVPDQVKTVLAGLDD
jgi:hypothetical protein